MRLKEVLAVLVILASNTTYIVHAADEDKQERFQYLFLESIRQQEKGNYAGAFDLLKECETIDSTSAEVNYMLSRYYYNLKDAQASRSYIEKASRFAPDNAYYKGLLANHALQNKEYDKAIAIYEQIYEQDHERGDVLEIITELARRTEKYDKAIWALDKLEILEGKTENRSMMKYHLFIAQKQDDKALAELSTLSGKYPYDLNYKVIMGDFYMTHEQEDKALKIYHDVLQQEPDNITGQMSLFQYYANNNDSINKQRLLNQMLLNKNITSETRVYLVRMALEDFAKEEKDSTEIIEFFQSLLQHPQEDQTLKTLYALYLESINIPHDTIAPILTEILEKEPNEASIRVRLIEYAWENKDFQKIIDLCIPARQYNPDELAFYYYQGIANFQLGKKDAVIEILQQGISTINEGSNPEIVSDFYAFLGDTYEQKGMKEEAYAAYDSCLQWKPDNIGCLNNYAYYLSVENRELDKAEQMSFKTIIKEPNNPTYLDTYAWILFQQGRYEDAKKYIDKTLAVVDSTDNDATLYDHAGDIYAQNGNITKAVEFWEKALQMQYSKLVARKIKKRTYIKK